MDKGAQQFNCPNLSNYTLLRRDMQVANKKLCDDNYKTIKYDIYLLFQNRHAKIFIYFANRTIIHKKKKEKTLFKMKCKIQSLQCRDDDNLTFAYTAL